MQRRFVPAKLHGLLDFLTLGLFFAGGGVFRIEDAPASLVASQVMGAALALYCPLTDYGPGPVSAVPGPAVLHHREAPRP